MLEPEADRSKLRAPNKQEFAGESSALQNGWVDRGRGAGEDGRNRARRGNFAGSNDEGSSPEDDGAEVTSLNSSTEPSARDESSLLDEKDPLSPKELSAEEAGVTTPIDRTQLADVWRDLRASIRKRIQPEQFETWFRRADLERADGGVLCIAVQNGFSRDWLRTYYCEVIEECAHRVLGHKVKVEFAVNPELTIALTAEESRAERAAPGADGSATHHVNGRAGLAESSERDALRHATSRGQGGSGRLGQADSQEAYPHSSPNTLGADGKRHSAALIGQGTVGGLARGSDVGLNPRYTFDNFVVGPCNRFCHAVSLGTAEAPGKTYNPLFLHGNVGLGKTHLLQAICYSLIQNWADVRILFLSCETFVNHFISALENGDLQKFRGKYRNVDVLVVDDIHLLANKERTQEEFFHTFNSLYNAGKQIILSSDSSPKEIPTLQDRLVSRFKWGLVTEIEPPCYETRMAILKRKGRERGRELPDEVAQIIAERVATNIRELEGAVNKLYSFSNVTGQAITLEFAKEVLTDVFSQRRGQPSMDDIIEVVTTHFSVKLSDLQSKKRTNQIAFPRQIAMYLARKITRHSLEEIGGFFGGRDHSTVLHAVRKIDELTKDDPATRDLLAGFLDALNGSSQ